MLVCGCLLFFPIRVAAQEKTLVRGNVQDEENYPLIQVIIIERDKENRTLSSAATDIDGNFSLQMENTNNSLVFRHMGYKEKVVVPGNNRVLKILMEEKVTEIAEVLVSGKAPTSLGGLPVAERDLSMAVSRINADEFEGMHVASIDEALQGRVSGVDIVGTTGNPGGGMAIRVRGLSSINGDNEPLIVIDGIPMESSVGATSGSFDFSTATEEEFSQMLNIPPSDIAEIIVLKDAAASALYGSRGADGVLLINTKRGTISPPRFEFTSTFTYSEPPKILPTLSGYEYVTMLNEAMLNAGRTLNPSTYPEFAYNPQDPDYYYNYSADTDWVKALNQNAFTQDYNLSLSGGSSKVRYRFSVGYWDEQGNTIGTGLQRLTTRTNLNYTVSDKLRFIADIAYTNSQTQRNIVPEASNLTKGDLRDKAYAKMPNQSIYYHNVYGERTSQYFTPDNNIQGAYPSIYNPVAIANDGKNDLTSDNAKPKFSLIYDLNRQWQFTFDVGLEFSNKKTEQYLPQTATGLLWNDSQTNWASDRDDDSFVMQTFTSARWTPKFNQPEKHNLVALWKVTTYDKQSNSFMTSTGNLPSAQLQDPSIDSRIYPGGKIESGFSQQRNLSALMNVNYSYLDRYIIYGSVRVDGDSRFGKDYRYGVFPALSGRYRISGEPFMKDIEWLNELSVRASWGVNGKSPKSDYMYYSMYDNYEFSYAGNTATHPSSITLNNLRWERTTQQNLGLNFNAFHDRLSLEFDYYKKETVDGIDKSPLPASSGFKESTMNLNTIENVGWELNVNLIPYTSKDLKVNLSFNVSRSQNFLRKLTEYAVTESGSWQKNGEYLTRLELNQPYGSFYGYQYDGVYLNQQQTIALDAANRPLYTMGENGQMVPVYMAFNYPFTSYVFQPGDARYVDINRDGNINLQDVVYLGDYNPLFIGGFGPTIRYKSFTLSSWFYFRYGSDVINMTRMQMEKMSNFDNQSTATLKRFTRVYEPGTEHQAPSNLLPRALYGAGYNWLGSDRFVEDGSFLKWKTVTLRYNFAKQLLAKYGIQGMSCWGTVQNIHTWTNYTGQDPEVSLNDKGKDSSRAPKPLQFTAGLTLSF